jgi:EAL domain-containing protein (putative c-di-GMP-specific phosphodiesterase class I)
MDDKFIRQMDRELTGWADPLERLSKALEADELELYCQPMRALQGAPGFPMAEVLVRMRAEESALLPPGEFLPVFEHYGMMPQLDRWVLRKTVQRLARGSRVPRFTINLSGQTLEDVQFPAYLAGELMRAGVPARSVLFEIDEPDLLSKPQAVARFVNATRAIGVGAMIDGFGRRLGSFAPLKPLGLAFLKIDGSIVRRITSSEPAGNKLKAIVRVAQALGIDTVAECVEEQDILIRAKALGCTLAQGFGVYRPHRIDSIAEGPPA